MRLLIKSITTVFILAALGAALLYAATHVGGSDAQWLYVMGSWGLVMVLVAVAFGRITYNTHHIRQLADQNAELRSENAEMKSELRDIKKDQDHIRQDVNSRLAVKQWRKAGMTSSAFDCNNGLRVISGGSEER